jgi:hypothetical protein
MLSVVFFLIAYAVVALAALTLAMRVVPPNPYFGFVTPRCLDNTELWYNVNAVGGQLILAVVGVCAIILMSYQGTWLKGFFSQLFLFVIPLAGAIGATLYFERKGGSWK